jgi:hypothetical protein
MCESIPPASLDPSLPPTLETLGVILIFAQKKRPIEVKYVEQ